MWKEVMMAALKTNKGQYTFVWYADNPFIEVFRPGDSVSTPFEVFEAGINYNQSSFKNLVNSHPDYK